MSEPVTVTLRTPTRDIECVVSKYVVVKSEKSFCHLDKLADGTWRLTMSEEAGS